MGGNSIKGDHDTCKESLCHDITPRGVHNADDNVDSGHDSFLDESFSTGKLQVQEVTEVVSKKERKDVRRIKILIFIVVAMSITGAVAVYFYTKSSERTQFHYQFNDDAYKVHRHIAIRSLIPV